MARTASHGLYEAIVETEKALATGPGLHAALSGKDTDTIANDVQAVAASLTALLDGLGQQVTQRYDRCLRDGCGEPLIQALRATQTLIGEAHSAVASLNWVFARLKQGGVPILDELQAVGIGVTGVDTATWNLLAGLAQLKPLVAPPRPARRPRPEIRADIDRDVG
jgi:hypothetical protein